MSEVERRCQVCCHDKGLRPARTEAARGMFFCGNFIACNARARKRLGIPAYQIRRLQAQERARMNDERHV